VFGGVEAAGLPKPQGKRCRGPVAAGSSIAEDLTHTTVRAIYFLLAVTPTPEKLRLSVAGHL